MSYAEEQLAHIQEQKERAMEAGREISPTEIGRIPDLINRLTTEIERQANAVELIQQKTASVLNDLPRSEALKEATDSVSGLSDLTITLEKILDGFQTNTNRLFSVADRIEL